MTARHELDRIAVRVINRLRLRNAVSGYYQRLVAARMTARQRLARLHQLDDRTVGDIAMLREAAADRQYRFELQAEVVAIEGLHRVDSLGENTDVHLGPIEFHRC